MEAGRSMLRETSLDWTAQFSKLALGPSGKLSTVPPGAGDGKAF
jgi:hypothetical protein